LNEADLSGADLINADLNNANLFAANLFEANLFRANLSRANLSAANLGEAKLSAANLSEANLINVNLFESNLSEANLRAAYLNGAKLEGANLINADLSEANLSRANLHWTTIAKIDLSITKGLATINHRGPSHIELFSVQLPQDGSALHFLRGAGVPEKWIDDYRAHMMHPVQYHSCFISYTNKDETLANRLHADLQAKGVRCWFAPEDMKIGDKIRERINEAIHLQDKLLLLLSEHTLESTWVETEVEAALAKERREKREVLFPVRLDGSIMGATQAWAEHLRIQRHIGNFTKWREPEAYEDAFERLLRDLKQS
jgi:hypothetical protein